MYRSFDLLPMVFDFADHLLYNEIELAAHLVRCIECLPKMGKVSFESRNLFCYVDPLHVNGDLLEYARLVYRGCLDNLSVPFPAESLHAFLPLKAIAAQSPKGQPAASQAVRSRSCLIRLSLALALLVQFCQQRVKAGV